MKINNLLLDVKQFGTIFLLVALAPSYEYLNGNRTENVRGYRYTIVMPEAGYERIDVLIDGAQRVEKPVAPTEVMLTGFSPYVSWRGGDYVVAARATGIAAAAKTKA